MKSTTIQPTAPTLPNAEELGKIGDGSFAQVLNKTVNQVNDLQVNADKQIQKLATGKTNNIPEVMMAVEKADIAMKLMMSVRNKMIDAYQEVMKMQV